MSSPEDMPGSWSWPEDIPEGLHHRAREPESSQSKPHSAAPKPESQPRQRRRHWGPRTCRICLETVLPTFHAQSEHVPGILQPEPRVTYDSEGGKLVSPCKCKGSQKYVHQECLEAWRHSDPSLRSRTYWECPTCKFKYKFSRLSWGRMIGSVGAQITLTTVIFIIAIFVLGFIADPIINMALNPSGHIFNLYGIFSTDRRPTYFPDDDEDDGSWSQHFTKGFASLGLLGVIKFMLTSPLQVWFRQGAGGGRGPTGRDRIQTTTWLLILLGAATAVWGIWKLVRAWSQRVLERAGDSVMDIQGDDDDDDDS